MHHPAAQQGQRRQVCVCGEDRDENEKQLDFQAVGVWQVYSGAVVNDFY